MTNKELFIQAFLEADAIEMEKYQNKYDFHYDFSTSFEKKMNKLIAKNNRISLYTRRKISKALIAAIIAIIVLFTGLMSVSASREKIIEFVENILSQYTQIELSEDSPETPDTIETAYTISNIPEGFTLKQYELEEIIAYAIWQNENGEEIVFRQVILNSELSIDNENYYEKNKLNGYDAYIYGDDLDAFMSWTDGKYWFSLHTPIRYKDDLIEMAENISIKNQ